MKWSFACLLLMALSSLFLLRAMVPEQDPVKGVPPSGRSGQEADGAADVEAFAAALNRFGLKLFEEAAPGAANTCTSPTSVAFTLLMAHAGAGGDTAKEMMEMLYPDLEGWTPDRARTAARRLLAHLRQQARDLEISIVNDIWPQDGHPLREGYVAGIQEVFAADVRALDYAKNAEGARRLINDHVARLTKDRIQDLIPAGMLDKTTLLVLTNAVYFKAKWVTPFEPDLTRPRPFHLADSTKVDVETMTRLGAMELATVEGARILRLPYRDSHRRYVMELVLPDVGKSPADVLATLGGKATFASTLVRLNLPKFTIRSEFQLTTALQAMGLRLATSPMQADFSGIDGGKGQLFIGEVVHKTFLEVGEAGTEAAAATAAVMRLGSAMQRDEPVLFIVDRPFLCTIRDQTTGLLLFISRVADPR